MQALTYTLIPLAALAIGALTTLRFNAGPLLRSAVQHLAAGVVFAAAAGEILPDVKHGGSLLAVIVGALTGIAAMLLLAIGTVPALYAATIIGGISYGALNGERPGLPACSCRLLRQDVRGCAGITPPILSEIFLPGL